MAKLPYKNVVSETLEYIFVVFAVLFFLLIFVNCVHCCRKACKAKLPRGVPSLLQTLMSLLGYYCFILCLILILYEELNLGFKYSSWTKALPSLVQFITIYSYVGLVIHFWLQSYLILGWFDFEMLIKKDLHECKRLPVYLVWALSMCYSCAMLVLIFLNEVTEFLSESLFEVSLFAVISLNVLSALIGIIISITGWCRLLIRPIGAGEYIDKKYKQTVCRCWKRIPQFIYASLLCNIFILPQFSYIYYWIVDDGYLWDFKDDSYDHSYPVVMTLLSDFCLLVMLLFAHQALCEQREINSNRHQERRESAKKRALNGVIDDDANSNPDPNRQYQDADASPGAYGDDDERMSPRGLLFDSSQPGSNKPFSNVEEDQGNIEMMRNSMGDIGPGSALMEQPGSSNGINPGEGVGGQNLDQLNSQNNLLQSMGTPSDDVNRNGPAFSLDNGSPKQQEEQQPQQQQQQQKRPSHHMQMVPSVSAANPVSPNNDSSSNGMRLNQENLAQMNALNNNNNNDNDGNSTNSEDEGTVVNEEGSHRNLQQGAINNMGRNMNGNMPMPPFGSMPNMMGPPMGMAPVGPGGPMGPRPPGPMPPGPMPPFGSMPNMGGHIPLPIQMQMQQQVQQQQPRYDAQGRLRNNNSISMSQPGPVPMVMGNMNPQFNPMPMPPNAGVPGRFNMYNMQNPNGGGNMPGQFGHPNGASVGSMQRQLFSHASLPSQPQNAFQQHVQQSGNTGPSMIDMNHGIQTADVQGVGGQHRVSASQPNQGGWKPYNSHPNAMTIQNQRSKEDVLKFQMQQQQQEQQREEQLKKQMTDNSNFGNGPGGPGIGGPGMGGPEMGGGPGGPGGPGGNINDFASAIRQQQQQQQGQQNYQQPGNDYEEASQSGTEIIKDNLGNEVSIPKDHETAGLDLQYDSESGDSGGLYEDPEDNPNEPVVINHYGAPPARQPSDGRGYVD